MAGKLLGEVVLVDDAGNLITDITVDQLDGVPRDERVTVTCDGHQTLGIFPTDHDQPDMTLLAYLNEQNQLSLGIVGESAEAFLGIRKGCAVVVSW